ncbi:hypothetical protein [Mucilaginibacter aquatilis]|uniref:DUF4329 domain-containing protein n=1 Tax=Mucilaginibacter aquatilis TaxID=1517760 RepID=A0A6I4IBV3_9SPHI|nr:hypothetical protein [Mucilaginibacter aquatilis]MVN92582.1 hypothetical protein [Mucilaginibacter aquatilis]
MNRLYNIKRSALAAFLLFCTVFVIYSCRKDSNRANDTPSSDTELIANARRIFEASITKGKVNVSSAVNPGASVAKYIDWKDAYTAQISVGKIVMLPVKFSTTQFIQVGSHKLPLDSLARLFIYTGKQGGKHIEVVTRIPDSEYLANNSKSKKFSGIITVTDWWGNFIKAFKFKNGNVSLLGAPEFRSGDYNKYDVLKYKTTDWDCVTIEHGTCVYAGGSVDCHTDWYEWYCEYTGGGGNQDDSAAPYDYEYGGGGNNPPSQPQQPDPKDPCNEKAKVKAKAENAVVANQNQKLLNNLNSIEPKSGWEYGTEHRLSSWPNGTYQDVDIRTSEQANTYPAKFYWHPDFGYTIGFTHSHPGGTAPSPADLYTMVNSLTNANLISAGQNAINFYKENVTMTVVTKDNGNYAMTIKDWSAMEQFRSQYAANPETYNDTYTANAQQFGNEVALLTMFGSSINLYKADSNSTNYLPRTLSSNNIVGNKPCPN